MARPGGLPVRPYRMKQYPTSPGEPYPLGATVLPNGVNFSLFSKNATDVELLLFNRFDDPEPFQVFRFHPHLNKTFHYWHVFIEGLQLGQIYGYRVHGPFDPASGMRFNPQKVLIDPYSGGVVYGKNWSREHAREHADNCPHAMKSLVIDPQTYDWENVESPHIPLSESIIYELHVRGFTRHASSGVKYPGTFDGLIEKIPYLKELGITTVELLPVQQFDPFENPYYDPNTHKQLTNYWGYNPVCFFSPHRGYYISDWEKMEYLTGFRDTVKAFHKAGLEVILDIVFNHTGEGNETGPTICFKGIENSVYYLLEEDKSQYSNYSGTGNTVSCNHPMVRRLILDCLRYWVTVMHVDGFRFDLASVLSRDEKGRPMEDPPLLWEIESDPILQKTKIIAEAWDAAGLYQVGKFPGERWAEWNGRFRDDVRRFVRGDDATVGAFASRLIGSPDLYQHLGREPYQSINYLTCHDGFTLRDLVSYNNKHNEANGENNRDGQNENFSANYGTEGPATDPKIESLRTRQMKNFLAILLLSQGTPMLLAGDEFGRSQQGNNNAYCQDNEISWMDWTLLRKEGDLFRFCKEMIHFRKKHPALRQRDYFWGQLNDQGWNEITWHGVKRMQPDWSAHSHSIAFTLAGFDQDADIHVIVNCYWEPLHFELPILPDGQSWFRCIDTSLPSPDDISAGIEVETGNYLATGRSVVCFTT
jgi:isoamylase